MEIYGCAAIGEMADTFEIGFATTPSAIAEVHRLRHRVFCEEHDILDGVDGLESDEFDVNSHHVTVRRRRGPIIATARVVTYRPDRPRRSFPMQLVCSPNVLAGLPLETTGEISRFAISRQLRGDQPGDQAPLRLALMRGILQTSQRLRLTHWCAAMEPALLRLLRRTAIDFKGVGPMIDYRGWRQPAVCAIGETLRRGRDRLPEAWSFVTRRNSYPQEMLQAA
jgi:N-acyl-L-homoserine lactone synthetase